MDKIKKLGERKFVVHKKAVPHEPQPDHPGFEERWLEDEVAAKERNIMDKQTASKIHDDAREKITEEILAPYYSETVKELRLKWGNIEEQNDVMLKVRRKYAKQLLAISGTTDIECPECKGSKKSLRMGLPTTCHVCLGTGGVIKHEWKIAVVLENGEPPENPYPTHPKYSQETNDDHATKRYAYQKSQQDMLKTRYRQVVE